tara:strand:+ start:106 stop:306 length:201 start_codon:yes stop_codon:yes gene_type:complete
MIKKQNPDQLLQEDKLEYIAWNLSCATAELKAENDKAELKEKARDSMALSDWMSDLPNRQWREANE